MAESLFPLATLLETKKKKTHRIKKMKLGILLGATAACTNAFIIPQGFQEAFALENTIQQEHTSTPDYVESSSFWPHLPYFLKPMVDTDKLQEKITVEELNSTAWDLYHVANSSTRRYGNPTRVIGSPGHWHTIHYILRQLDELRDYYDISLQSFKALTGKVNSYNLTLVDGDDIPTAVPFSLSPPVEPFVGRLVHIPNLGCSDADYQALKVGKNEIALIERGECAFGVKSNLAGKYGFKAVVVYDNDPTSVGGVRGTLEKPKKHTVSTIGISYLEGKRLRMDIEKDQSFSLFFAMDSFVEEVKTKNVIAETKHGDSENIVALGAHSDSVESGPGINDDGSGTISLLTVAKYLSNFKINNKVRFAWWSAEEEGLLGSNYYVEQLTPEENSKIRLFMDYDMMASPNYEYQVYDANNIDNPKGSQELKDLYIDYYVSHGLNYTLIPFDGRSDYVAFIKNGIPGGGIATGAEGPNSRNGKVLDKCYHDLCDDVSNLSFDAFLTNTKLIAHSVATYAKSLEDFPQREVNATVSSTDAQPFDDKLKYRGSMLIMWIWVRDGF